MRLRRKQLVMVCNDLLPLIVPTTNKLATKPTTIITPKTVYQMRCIRSDELYRSEELLLLLSLFIFVAAPLPPVLCFISINFSDLNEWICLLGCRELFNGLKHGGEEGDTLWIALEKVFCICDEKGKGEVDIRDELESNEELFIDFVDTKTFVSFEATVGAAVVVHMKLLEAFLSCIEGKTWGMAVNRCAVKRRCKWWRWRWLCGSVALLLITDKALLDVTKKKVVNSITKSKYWNVPKKQRHRSWPTGHLIFWFTVFFCRKPLVWLSFWSTCSWSSSGKV